MRASRTRPVLILDSPRFRPCSALGDGFSPVCVEDWDRLTHVLAGAPPAAVALVDPYRDGAEPAPELWRLLDRFPSVSVVAALELRPERIGDARRMLAAGVSELLSLPREASPAAAAHVLRAVHARPLKRRLDGALSRYLAADARVLVRAAAEVAASGGGAPDLAARLGISLPTLDRWCAGAALPTPRRLQVWMRLLLAGLLLEDAGRSVARVAAACGYATDRSLRRAMQGFLGAGSRALRREGAFARAAEAFNAELRQLREEVRRPRSQAARMVAPMRAGMS